MYTQTLYGEQTFKASIRCTFENNEKFVACYNSYIKREDHYEYTFPYVCDCYEYKNLQTQDTKLGIPGLK